MTLSQPNRRGRAAPLLLLGLERGSPLPLQRQLYEQVREVILAGRLGPGARLPSTRALARELPCSRTTVIGAYDQLLSEGYLEGQAGAGTFVSPVLPEDLLGMPTAAGGGGAGQAFPEAGPDKLRPSGLSRRGRVLAALRVVTDARAERLSRKIVDARHAGIPVLIAVGKREARNGTVSLRRWDGAQETLDLDSAVEALVAEAAP